MVASGEGIFSVRVAQRLEVPVAPVLGIDQAGA